MQLLTLHLKRVSTSGVGSSCIVGSWDLTDRVCIVSGSVATLGFFVAGGVDE